MLEHCSVTPMNILWFVNWKNVADKNVSVPTVCNILIWVVIFIIFPCHPYSWIAVEGYKLALCLATVT